MADPASEHPALLRSFLDALDRIKALQLPMIELRPREKTPLAAFSGDYDFVADPKYLRDILSVFLEECLRNGVHLEYNCDFRNKRVLMLRSPGNSISVELWTRLELSGGRTAGAYHEIEGGALLDALARARTGDEADAILAAVYVTHVVHKGKDIAAPLQKDRIAFFRDALTSVADSDDPQSGRLLAVLGGMADGKLDAPAANRTAVEYLSARGAPARHRRLNRLLYRRTRKAWLLSDRIVPVLGPDGSGKTYFCENLLAADQKTLVHLPFKQLFRSSKDYWILQRLLNPRKTQPANVVDESLSAYIVPKSILTGRLFARRLRKTSKVAITDRYSWDYLFRNLRTRDIPPGAACFTSHCFSSHPGRRNPSS